LGGRLLYRVVLEEAKNRVRLDLNAAREIYLTRVKGVEVALNITALGPGFRGAVKLTDARQLAGRLRRMAQYAELDFAGIVTKEGGTLCRVGPNSISRKKAALDNPLAGFVRERGVPVSGTVLLSREFLLAENPELAERAKIALLPTPMAAPRPEVEETSGMALAAAIPLFENDELLGILYGGVLLNRSPVIVDTVRETVFQQETYRGQSIGTATIFLKDLRISTNVLMPDGKRAIGTRVSQEVRDRVLLEGQKWADRAFVVNDWYLTVYEPIVDIFGQRVGMLYVGVLEAKYVTVGRRALSIFALITVAGLGLAIGLGYTLANKIMRPMQRLIKASAQVSQGDLSPEVGPVSKDEIGILQKTFQEMLLSLQERDRRQRVESETKLLQTERQASIGRLAAGVAHEINNPLTGVLSFTHMLLRRKDLGDDIRSDLRTIVQATERVRKIVRGLLDFSHQTKLELEPTDVNGLVRSAIALVENQALIKGVSLDFKPGEGLPTRNLDRSQLQGVLLNIIINALDATKPGDTITVSTGLSLSTGKNERKGIEIAVADTGCGIPPENLDKLFDPFFSTKEVGQGTGLGLSVSLGIVERHGGTIRVQSEVDRGSTFTIWLSAENGNGNSENTGRG
jgi:two-component system NtrC family sensor kinase